jgi:purine-binding chemotaxis protein CheW
MREGQRDGEDDSPEIDDTDEQSAGSDPEAAAGAVDEAPGANETTATASAGSGATATTAKPETDESETADEAAIDAAEADETDKAVDEAVKNVGGTRAELPSTEQMEVAMEQTMEQAEQVTDEDDSEAETDPEVAETADDEPAGPAGLAGEAEQTKEADTRILEFTLDDEQYCLDIQYIEEIVKHTSITRVPNTPEFIEGVVDLRGQITTILNPKVTIDKPNKDAGDLIVVFDGDAFEDQGHIGWVVDDVRQVSPISDDQVNTPPMQEDYINGVIDRDDGEFVIWTTPDLALEEAE